MFLSGIYQWGDVGLPIPVMTQLVNEKRAAGVTDADLRAALATFFKYDQATIDAIMGGPVAVDPNLVGNSGQNVDWWIVKIAEMRSPAVNMPDAWIRAQLRDNGVSDAAINALMGVSIPGASIVANAVQNLVASDAVTANSVNTFSPTQIANATQTPTPAQNAVQQSPTHTIDTYAPVNASPTAKPPISGITLSAIAAAALAFFN